MDEGPPTSFQSRNSQCLTISGPISTPASDWQHAVLPILRYAIGGTPTLRTAKPGIKPHGLCNCYMQPKWPQDFRHSWSYCCISLYNMKQRDPHAWDASQVLGEFVRLDESVFYDRMNLCSFLQFLCACVLFYMFCVCVFCVLLCLFILLSSFKSFFLLFL